MNSVLLIASISLLCVIGASGSGFKYVGLSESGPEWGNNIPGTYYVDYVFPATSSIDYYVNSGMNVIRLPFLWERIQPTLNGPFDQTYLGLINKTVQYVTVTKGVYCMLDVHNYGRYKNVILGKGVDYSAFQALWNQLASLYKNNPKIIFGLMNEPYEMPNINVQLAMQAGINGVRSSGATQLITVPGNDWTGVHSWVNGGSSAVMGAITDPLNNFMYEMHQYFDNNYSGNGACNVNFDPETVFADATFWLRSQGKTAMLGEFGIENNPGCVAVLARTMAYLNANSDVWQGLSWWAVGPWWGSYKFTLDAGKGDEQLAVLKNYMPSSAPISAPTVVPAPSTPVVVPAPPTVVPAPATPVAQTVVTTGRAKANPAPVASTTTTGSVTMPTPAPQTPANSGCTSGYMKCLTPNTFSTCNWGAWAAAQTCGPQTVCAQSENYIYCVSSNNIISTPTPVVNPVPKPAPVTPTAPVSPVPTPSTTVPEVTPTPVVPAPVPTPTPVVPTPVPVVPTPVPTTPSTDSCTLGQSRCLGGSSYQSCSNGRSGYVWAAAQKCQTGLSCNQHGNAVYCY